MNMQMKILTRLFMKSIPKTSGSKLGISLKFSTKFNFDHQHLDKGALLDWCKDNVLYEDENIIALNKPAGVPQYSISSETLKGQDRIVGIDELIPMLCEEWKVPSLHICLPFSRFQSGIMLFTKNTTSSDRMKQILQTAKAQKGSFMSHLVLTVGVPTNIKEMPMETMIFTKKKLDDMTVTVTIPDQSKKGKQTGEEIQAYFCSRILAVNKELNVAALQVNTNRDKWHCLEVYLTRKLCSALGDHLYSGRVKPVLGTLTMVPPEAAIVQEQVISKAVRTALKMKNEPVKSLPLHIHRYQVELFQFPTKKSKPIVIKAPLPVYFEKSLHLLDLFNDNIHRNLDTDML